MHWHTRDGKYDKGQICIIIFLLAYNMITEQLHRCDTERFNDKENQSINILVFPVVTQMPKDL